DGQPRGQLRVGGRYLKRHRATPGMAGQNRTAQPQPGDRGDRVSGEAVDSEAGRRQRRAPVRARIESDQAAVEVLRHPVPDPGVRAQSVEEEQRRLLGCLGVPFQVMQVDAPALNPTLAHGRVWEFMCPADQERTRTESYAPI